MKLTGECVLVKDGDVWTATFPQFGFAATSGKTRAEAIGNAQEVLELEASDLMDDGARAPRMTHVAEVVVLTADVSEDESRAMSCLTQAQAADELGVSRPRVSALVSSGKLDVEEVGGRKMVTIESLNRYRAEPRVPGRPKSAPCPAGDAVESSG